MSMGVLEKDHRAGVALPNWFDSYTQKHTRNYWQCFELCKNKAVVAKKRSEKHETQICHAKVSLRYFRLNWPLRDKVWSGFRFGPSLSPGTPCYLTAAPKTVAVECLRLSHPRITPDGWTREAVKEFSTQWQTIRIPEGKDLWLRMDTGQTQYSSPFVSEIKAGATYHHVCLRSRPGLQYQLRNL